MTANMTNETQPIGENAANTAQEQARRDWVTPQFDCIPLSEAMGSGINSSVTDGTSLYS